MFVNVLFTFGAYSIKLSTFPQIFLWTDTVIPNLNDNTKNNSAGITCYLLKINAVLDFKYLCGCASVCSPVPQLLVGITDQAGLVSGSGRQAKANYPVGPLCPGVSPEIHTLNQ